jgi:protein-S-isoprenylcysteine O-methyltransferase Ste14
VSSPSRHPIVIAFGDFFFRFRNGLFPVFAALLLFFTRPNPVFANPGAHTAWLCAGAAVCLLGEAIRLFTIGYRYIDRGGRGGKVYASKLVTEGVYRQTRNPMYVGNALIVIGIAMFSGSFPAFFTAVPAFLFIYWTITAAEERYLRGSFGEDYETYCRTVPRFLPRLTGWSESLAGMTFDWKRALRKDYGTMLVVALPLILLPLWRRYLLLGPDAARDLVPAKTIQTAVAVALYLLVLVLKKANRLADLQPAQG